MNKYIKNMVSVRSKKIVLFTIGTILFLVGAVLGAVWGIIYDMILKSQLSVTNSSRSFKIWKDIPIPIYMEFYFFNWTNPEATSASVKPHFVEIGPYVFREYHHRVNIVWNANETVTYRQVRSWHFKPEMSNGSLDDKVTNLNMVAATVGFQTRFYPMWKKILIDFVMKRNAELVVTKTVGELLFDGYDDPFLDMVKNFSHVPFDRFGYFVQRNNSPSYDGTFNMFTGVTDLKEVGIIKRWNFENHTGLYGSPCDEVRGSSGDLWPPMVGVTSAQIFTPDLCFSLPLFADGSIETYGLSGTVYVGNEQTLDNGKHFPEALCQCVHDCQPYGTLNASSCRFGSPLFVSFPHFYLADPSYVNSIQGLKPDAAKHKFFIALQPETGMPLHVAAKLQLNAMVEKWAHLSLFKHLPQDPMYIPILWFAERADLPPDMADMARTLLALPVMGHGILFGIAGLGVFIILVGILLSCRQEWSDMSHNDTDSLIHGEVPPSTEDDYSDVKG